MAERMQIKEEKQNVVQRIKNPGVVSKNYYQVLGVERDAGEPEIKSAYQKRMDSSKKLKDSEGELRFIEAAYDVLKNPFTRDNYKRGLELREEAEKRRLEEENGVEEQKISGGSSSAGEDGRSAKLGDERAKPSVGEAELRVNEREQRKAAELRLAKVREKEELAQLTEEMKKGHKCWMMGGEGRRNVFGVEEVTRYSPEKEIIEWEAFCRDALNFDGEIDNLPTTYVEAIISFRKKLALSMSGKKGMRGFSLLFTYNKKAGIFNKQLVDGRFEDGDIRNAIRTSNKDEDLKNCDARRLFEAKMAVDAAKVGDLSDKFAAEYNFYTLCYSLGGSSDIEGFSEEAQKIMSRGDFYKYVLGYQDQEYNNSILNFYKQCVFEYQDILVDRLIKKGLDITKKENFLKSIGLLICDDSELKNFEKTENVESLVRAYEDLKRESSRDDKDPIKVLATEAFDYTCESVHFAIKARKSKGIANVFLGVNNQRFALESTVSRFALFVAEGISMELSILREMGSGKVDTENRELYEAGLVELRNGKNMNNRALDNYLGMYYTEKGRTESVSS